MAHSTLGSIAHNIPVAAPEFDMCNSLLCAQSTVTIADEIALSTDPFLTLPGPIRERFRTVLAGERVHIDGDFLGTLDRIATLSHEQQDEFMDHLERGGRPMRQIKKIGRLRKKAAKPPAHTARPTSSTDDQMSSIPLQVASELRPAKDAPRR